MFKRMFYQMSRVATYTAAILLFRIRIHREGRLPETGGMVFASNHQSFYDPAFISFFNSRPVSFMARSTLFRNPLFSLLIRSLNAFPIERDKTDFKGMKEAVRRLKGGGCMLLFPEGTRSADGSLARPKPGFHVLAVMAGVPIVPVLIVDAHKAWGKGHRLPHGLPHIKLVHGRPFVLDRQCTAEQAIERLVSEWKRLEAKYSDARQFRKNL